MQSDSKQHTGPHQRHYLRKLDNLLFDEDTTSSERSQSAAQNKDHELRVAYERELAEVLQQTVALKPNEESDVILKLKEDLDRLYETAAAIAENREQQQQAISQLLIIIMSAIRKAAGNDVHALKELDQEELAREAHFMLLQSPLVADLLNPESPILEKELVPTLLSAKASDLSLALQIFDESQLVLILQEAEHRLTKLPVDHPQVQHAMGNLHTIRAYSTRLQQNQL